MDKVIKLESVKLAELKQALKRSLSLGGESLNFLISSSTISNVACTDNESVFKRWSIITSEVCGFTQQFNPIKCSIYKGGVFVTNILSYFGAECNIDLHYDTDTNEATRMIVFNENLHIDLVMAPVGMVYPEFSEAIIESMFVPAETLYSFDLQWSIINELISLSKLDTNTDKQTTYIELKTVDGILIATDGSFERKLMPIDQDITDIKIDKTLLKFLCKEDYKVTIQELKIHDQTHVTLLAKSLQSNTQAVINLVASIDDNSDVFDMSKTEFSWD